MAIRELFEERRKVGARLSLGIRRKLRSQKAVKQGGCSSLTR